MMKPYIVRSESGIRPVNHPAPVLVTKKGVPEVGESPSICDNITNDSMKLKISEVLADLESKLHHLSHSQQEQLFLLIMEFTNILPDRPQQTPIVSHNVDVGGSHPIKQHPYCVNLVKLEAMRKEIDYYI